LLEKTVQAATEGNYRNAVLTGAATVFCWLTSDRFAHGTKRQADKLHDQLLRELLDETHASMQAHKSKTT
jgi:hypothetical protein